MTKAVRDRILKDANGDISDHLRNHIHLTNCIHLKNHIHKQSPMMSLSDRSLMRDLIVLQRSRSLRDPSASPPSWHSKDKGENDPPAVPREARFPSSKVSPVGREDSNRTGNPKIETFSTGKNVGDTSNDRFSGNSKSKKKGKQKMAMKKTLSEQLESDAENRVRDRREKSVSTVKRRRFRRARRQRVGTREEEEEAIEASEMSVASNTPAEHHHHHRRRHEEEEEFGRRSMAGAGPGNGCGIPWNWSSIHHRGKTFLDMAGRSLSCGRSDSRMKRGGNGKDVIEMMPAEGSGDSSSSSEAHPLLVDGSVSQESSENAIWARRRYSGELGIYAGKLFRRDFDSDLASEARSGERHKSRNHGRHQNLTQKYAPRIFRDLVGQSLVVQALSNAVARRKVGILYVFYGPHGTGKTSCARIFSRALNCRSSDRPKPCGFCDPCVAHEKGKSRSIREVGPVSNFDFERIMDLLDNMAVASSQIPSHHRVFIFDDCDTLTPECWSAISKVVDRAPRRVVFVLVCSSLDVLPHIIISRCQKFFFPKLKDADIVYTLQWIAAKEGLEIDKDALKLIASRSDGSLRDAEMTLDQLSLLGQRISVPLVQELVGLISDEKLVDLLDLALSADTVNTVKNLRVIMETGVDPLGLMSQLATIITDVLAGSYDFTRGRPRRKFFRNQPLSKEDMEKLRQALKTLSEAEKQLRTSNDKLTWLTAALLQLAPDPQYLLPSSSSVDTSFDRTPLPSNNPRGDQSHVAMSSERGLPGSNVRQSGNSEPRHSSGHAMEGLSLVDRQRQQGKQVSSIRRGIEEIWVEVLDKIQYNGVREFLHQEGKLVSVSFGAAPTAQLMFSSHLTKSSAEKFRGHILQAFEAVLGSPLTIEIRCEPPRKDKPSSSSLSQMRTAASGPGTEPQARGTTSKSEIVEVGHDTASSPKGVSVDTPQRRLGEQNRCRSIVRSKVSLAHVIQQVEGCSQHGVWSKRKAVSIAEKLEQENLRLEPRSRSLLCWKATKVTRRKLSRLKVRARKSRSLLKLVTCGECLSTKSPR